MNIQLEPLIKQINKTIKMNEKYLKNHDEEEARENCIYAMAAINTLNLVKCYIVNMLTNDALQNSTHADYVKTVEKIVSELVNLND